MSLQEKGRGYRMVRSLAKIYYDLKGEKLMTNNEGDPWEIVRIQAMQQGQLDDLVEEHLFDLKEAINFFRLKVPVRKMESGVVEQRARFGIRTMRRYKRTYSTLERPYELATQAQYRDDVGTTHLVQASWRAPQIINNELIYTRASIIDNDGKGIHGCEIEIDPNSQSMQLSYINTINSNLNATIPYHISFDGKTAVEVPVISQ